MKLRDMFYFIAFFFLQAKLLLQNEFNDTGAAVHPSEANLTFIRMHFASLLTVETADNPGHVWLHLKQWNKDAGRCLHTTVPIAAWSNLLGFSVGYGLKNCVLMCFSFCFPSNLQLKHLKRKTSLLCLSDVQNFHRNKKCHEVSLNVSYVALWLSERMETYLSVQ